MKILVVGAAGMLGRDVVRELEGEHSVETATRAGRDADHALDVVDADAVEALVGAVKVDVLVNCAAYTAVDDCEENRELAHAVNGMAPGHLAGSCTRHGTRLFHVSTDYVFDGEKDEPYVEDDATSPRSVYGESKLAGEEAVLASGADHVIGRVQWLYGAGGKNFAATMLGLAGRHPSLKVVDDQHGCPTWTVEAARCMRRMIEAGVSGVHHMSARGATTWYGFTRALLDAVGKSDFPLEPCTTDEFPRPAPRPRNSVLRNARLEATIGDEMQSWDAVIEDYLGSLKA